MRRATVRGAARMHAAPLRVAPHYRCGPTMPTWQPLPRHWQWHRTIFCRATENGAAKKGIQVN
jgi:hypothetical protein